MYLKFTFCFRQNNLGFINTCILWTSVIEDIIVESLHEKSHCHWNIACNGIWYVTDHSFIHNFTKPWNCLSYLIHKNWCLWLLMKQQNLLIVLLITMVKSISCGGVFIKVSPLIEISWIHLTIVTRLTTLLLKWSYCLMTIWNQQFIMKKKAEFMML